MRIQVSGTIYRIVQQSCQPINGFQMTADSLSQGILLLFEHCPCRLTVLWRQVIGIFMKPVAGEDVFQFHQCLQVVLSRVAEESRQPDHCLSPSRMGLAELMNFGQVIPWPVAWIVDRVVHNQSPVIPIILKRGWWQLANIGKQHGRLSACIPPEP